jgi:hypothetical protein
MVADLENSQLALEASNEALERANLTIARLQAQISSLVEAKPTAQIDDEEINAAWLAASSSKRLLDAEKSKVKEANSRLALQMQETERLRRERDLLRSRVDVLESENVKLAAKLHADTQGHPQALPDQSLSRATTMLEKSFDDGCLRAIARMKSSAPSRPMHFRSDRAFRRILRLTRTLDDENFIALHLFLEMASAQCGGPHNLVPMLLSTAVLNEEEFSQLSRIDTNAGA